MVSGSSRSIRSITRLTGLQYPINTQSTHKNSPPGGYRRVSIHATAGEIRCGKVKFTISWWLQQRGRQLERCGERQIP